MGYWCCFMGFRFLLRSRKGRMMPESTKYWLKIFLYSSLSTKGNVLKKERSERNKPHSTVPMAFPRRSYKFFFEHHLFR